MSTVITTNFRYVENGASIVRVSDKPIVDLFILTHEGWSNATRVSRVTLESVQKVIAECLSQWPEKTPAVPPTPPPA